MAGITNMMLLDPISPVEEGAVYAMCMAGHSDQATLARWICGLQETNPILGRIPTVFRLESGTRELQAAEDVGRGPDQNQQPGTEQEHYVEEEVQHSRGMKQWVGCGDSSSSVIVKNICVGVLLCTSNTEKLWFKIEQLIRKPQISNHEFATTVSVQTWLEKYVWKIF